jgi:hypothetical protein
MYTNSQIAILLASLSIATHLWFFQIQLTSILISSISQTISFDFLIFSIKSHVPPARLLDSKATILLVCLLSKNGLRCPGELSVLNQTCIALASITIMVIHSARRPTKAGLLLSLMLSHHTLLLSSNSI